MTDAPHPLLPCDLVMKGGITSGIVFPRAIQDLARNYRFRNLAGTSAGAIAAVFAAAAEYGRREGTRPDAMSELGRLAEWIGKRSPTTGRTNLLQLFQPTPELQPAFELGTLWLRKVGTFQRLRGILWALRRQFLWGLAGAVPGIGLAVSLIAAGGAPATDALLFAPVVAVAALLLTGLTERLVRLCTASLVLRATYAAVALITAGVMMSRVAPWTPDAPQRWVLPQLVALGLAIVGYFATAFFQFAKHLLARLPEQNFGLCPGMEQDAEGGDPALSSWMHRSIQELAGRQVDDTPLTFGDLQDAEDDRTITLRTMTTCLTHGRPYLLPFRQRDLFFDPEEFRRLFPRPVVDHLVAIGERIAAGDTGKQHSARFAAMCRAMYPRLPLPREEDLPILLAARMSLSFPFLLGAVSLWSVDWRSPANARASDAWKQWGSGRPAAHPEGLHDPANPLPSDAPADLVIPEQLWFSDGGLSSNFPVHLFDQLIPRWPTFAINLRYRKTPVPDTERVTMAHSHSAGKGPEWFRMVTAGSDGAGSVPGFLGVMLTAMKDWVDNTALVVPGYPDRIAHVNLGPGDGGLNLEMSPTQIEMLVERGSLAAKELTDRFLNQNAEGAELSWDNHRWTRLRSTLAVLQEQLDGLRSAFLYVGPGKWRSYAELLARGDGEHPTSYAWKKDGQREAAQRAIQRIGELLDEIDGMAEGGLRDKGVPKPEPELQLRPRL